MESGTDSIPISGVPKMDHGKKTSVTWLRETCCRFRASEIYSNVETQFLDGTKGVPYFQCSLHLKWKGSEYDVTGGGRAKKEAKRVAAAAILRQMEVFAKAELDIIGYHPDKIPIQHETDATIENSDNKGNPVSYLQELCMKINRPQPIYECQSEVGMPHELLYRVACHVGDEFVQYAVAKSKKIGKRESARNMATYINSLEAEILNPSIFDLEDDDKIIEEIRALRLKNEQKNKSPTKETKSSSSSSRKKSSYFIYENPYKGVPGPELSKLKDDPNFIPASPIAFLSNLGKEQGFEVQYMEIEEIASDGTYQCFVLLTLEPVATLFGVGLTQKEAKVNSALDAIHFVQKMMAKY